MSNSNEEIHSLSDDQLEERISQVREEIKLLYEKQGSEPCLPGSRISQLRNDLCNLGTIISFKSSKKRIFSNEPVMAGKRVK